MNILYLNHYAGSPLHGMEYRPYYLAREWVRSGHVVRMVAADFSHVRAVQPDLAGLRVGWVGEAGPVGATSAAGAALSPTLSRKRERGQEQAGDNSASVLPPSPACGRGAGGEGRSTPQNIDGIAYHWYATPAYAGNGLGRVKNIWAFLRQVWLDAPRIAREFQPDVVIASSTYPMDIWVAQRIARLTRQQGKPCKLVFEVHDLWPLSPIELNGMSPWHPFIVLCQAAENYAYQHADIVISMLPKVAAHMQAHGLDLRKLHIVPNGIALDEWQHTTQADPHTQASSLPPYFPSPTGGGQGGGRVASTKATPDVHAVCPHPNLPPAGEGAIRVPRLLESSAVQSAATPLRADIAQHIASQKAAGRTVVGYAGSHGTPNALDVMLQAAAQLKNEAFSFVLVGSGHEKTALQQQAQALGLQDTVAFFDPIPKAQIPSFLAQIAIAYIGWQRVPIYRFGIAPNKLRGCASSPRSTWLPASAWARLGGSLCWTITPTPCWRSGFWPRWRSTPRTLEARTPIAPFAFAELLR